jgi:hypothetical protein
MNGDITGNTNTIKRIIMEYFENLYSNKLKSLEEMDKFQGAFDLLKIEPRGYQSFKQIYNK